MDDKRVPLYERLPEIYRLKDAERRPPDHLKAFLALVEKVFGHIHEDIESLYDNLFIDTCDDWVIPYIGDLLGVSHLKGDPWTLRADVANTIMLRRRKGTIASIERLTYNLTKWAVHCVELRENLAWSQNLNHQRPDIGGDPPYGLRDDVKEMSDEQKALGRAQPIRGGTMTVRDPATLSLLDTPFDSFAHVADVKPAVFGVVRHNLPNLAIFLWRLKAYRVKISKPHFSGFVKKYTNVAGAADYIVRFCIHPMGDTVRLFNTHRFDPDADPPVVTRIDETPNPIPRERLSQDSPAGNPEAYISVDTYEIHDDKLADLDNDNVPLQLFILDNAFPGASWPKEGSQAWKIKGADLTGWEGSVRRVIENGDILVDPELGRIIIGVDAWNKTSALKHELLVSYTYGAVGPVGAHPESRYPLPEKIGDNAPKVSEVKFHDNPDSLQNALDTLSGADAPDVIEIQDSMTHTIKKSNIKLSKSLIIRSAENERPIIVLGDTPPKLLKFGAVNVDNASNLTLRLEGLYITREAEDEPLIAQASLGKLEIVGCTLDPGGYKDEDGERTHIRRSMRITKAASLPSTEIIVEQTVTGPLLIDGSNHLSLTNSIVDAGKGVGDDSEQSFAVSGTTKEGAKKWGPSTEVNGVTFFGRTRVESISGKGGIWVHSLEVLNNQKGCIRYSYFSGKGDRLTQHLGCVFGFVGDTEEAALRFTEDFFGAPAYGQLARATDFAIRERGSKDDAMGAFGFLLEAHKWRNIQIRYREFMPVGVRPLLIPIT